LSAKSALVRTILMIFGTWSVTVLAVVSTLATLLLFLPLPLKSRRNITRTAAKIWLRMSFIPLQVDGQEQWAELPAVVVANHASYLDGIILHAALPADFAFVIKREVTQVPGVHFLLRRIGAHFVERKNRLQGGRDAKRIVEQVSAGGSLAVFPEGTFIAEPGLGPFRTGAFAAATSAQLDVIPIVISGSRQVLSANDWLPRPGTLRIRALQRIACQGSDRAEMRRLATLSRAAILEQLDEPDRAQR